MLRVIKFKVYTFKGYTRYGSYILNTNYELNTSYGSYITTTVAGVRWKYKFGHGHERHSNNDDNKMTRRVERLWGHFSNLLCPMNSSSNSNRNPNANTNTTPNTNPKLYRLHPMTCLLARRHNFVVGSTELSACHVRLT